MATNIDYYARVAEKFSFDNTPLLAAAGINFLVGYLQYTYAIRLSLREGKSPMPYWMHALYLAHDSTWSYTLGSVAPQYGNHWFLRGTSTALLLWTALEVWSIHRAITKERAASFGALLGPSPSLPATFAYASFLQLAMYGIIHIGIQLMGEKCVMQWFCLTNVVIAVGPVHEYLRRGSRDGLSLGFCLVNVVGTVWTFAPFGMWALTIPEIFAQPAYYCIGVVLTVYSMWAFWIVAQYPPKRQEKGKAAPIW